MHAGVSMFLGQTNWHKPHNKQLYATSDSTIGSVSLLGKSAEKIFGEGKASPYVFWMTGQTWKQSKHRIQSLIQFELLSSPIA